MTIAIGITTILILKYNTIIKVYLMVDIIDGTASLRHCSYLVAYYIIVLRLML